MKEQIIQKQVLDYLRASGYYAWKNYNTGIYDPHRHLFRTIETKGVADITAIKNSNVLFCEIKNESGMQSEHQIEFQKQIESHGGKYLLIRSVEDLIGAC